MATCEEAVSQLLDLQAGHQAASTQVGTYEVQSILRGVARCLDFLLRASSLSDSVRMHHTIYSGFRADGTTPKMSFI